GDRIMQADSPLSLQDMTSGPRWTRREMLRLAGTAAAASTTWPQARAAEQPVRQRAKRILVAGAGIGGLCCAYELMERGHDVTVLEAAGRTGGHVRTIRDPLPDWFYADVGAEHFTRPGYDLWWQYIHQLNLPVPEFRRLDDM